MYTGSFQMPAKATAKFPLISHSFFPKNLKISFRHIPQFLSPLSYFKKQNIAPTFVF
jgi:hypothetical protein